MAKLRLSDDENSEDSSTKLRVIDLYFNISFLKTWQNFDYSDEESAED